jgi:hypothetical protein
MRLDHLSYQAAKQHTNVHIVVSWDNLRKQPCVVAVVLIDSNEEAVDLVRLGDEDSGWMLLVPPLLFVLVVFGPSLKDRLPTELFLPQGSLCLVVPRSNDRNNRISQSYTAPNCDWGGFRRRQVMAVCRFRPS